MTYWLYSIPPLPGHVGEFITILSEDQNFIIEAVSLPSINKLLGNLPKGLKRASVAYFIAIGGDHPLYNIDLVHFAQPELVNRNDEFFLASAERAKVVRKQLNDSYIINEPYDLMELHIQCLCPSGQSDKLLRQALILSNDKAKVFADTFTKIARSTLNGMTNAGLRVQ